MVGPTGEWDRAGLTEPALLEAAKSVGGMGLVAALLAGDERGSYRLSARLVGLARAAEAGHGGVQFGHREELPVAQWRQHPHLDQSDRIFRGRFVPWLSDPCRDNRHVVMAAERVIAAVQHRIPIWRQHFHWQFLPCFS